MHTPEVSYLICANQRSGSTMLCRALSDTGVAGHPDEYFLTGPASAFPPGWKFWEDSPLAERHGVRTREDYLDLVYEVGSTPNGVFGAKLMFNNVPWVLRKFGEMPRFAGRSRREVFTTAFPGLRVVHLTRIDRVRQAVSWARAAQDGVWVAATGEPIPPPAATPDYSYDFIDGLLRLIEGGEAGWLTLYDELGVTPLHLTYEELTDPQTYEDSLRRVLDHIGVTTQTPIGPPRTARQADALNEEWVERYLADRAVRTASQR